MTLANCKLARVDMEVAAAVPLGDRAQSSRLMRRQDPPGQPQAKHKSVLVGGDVKEPVKLVQEDVGSLRKPPSRGVGEHLIPHVERVLCSLGELFRRQLAASVQPTVLRLPMNIGRIF